MKQRRLNICIMHAQEIIPYVIKHVIQEYWLPLTGMRQMIVLQGPFSPQHPHKVLPSKDCHSQFSMARQYNGDYHNQNYTFFAFWRWKWYLSGAVEKRSSISWGLRLLSCKVQIQSENYICQLNTKTLIRKETYLIVIKQHIHSFQEFDCYICQLKTLQKKMNTTISCTIPRKASWCEL